jgi:hypothetical protein
VPARAEPVVRPRSHVRLAFEACLVELRDAIQRAVWVESGELVAVAEPEDAVDVQIGCARDGIDAGVVLEVRWPGRQNDYRYALDWHTVPLDVRPRLVGLAVVEAVDASRIELTAVPELPRRTAAIVASPGFVPEPPAEWTLVVAVGRRSFASATGVEVGGLSVALGRRLGHRVQLRSDLAFEHAGVFTSSGQIDVESVSTAPHIALRFGGRVYAGAGVGARLGLVRMNGTTFMAPQIHRDRLIRTWAGPVASGTAGVALSSRISVEAELEIGTTVLGATGRDLDKPAAVMSGAWTSFAVAAAVAL